MVRYVPNILTVFRLLCLPVFFWLYGLQAPGFAWKAALLMFFAALSDLADGYIARKYHVESEFGRILDPIVDRLFFLTVFVAYIYYGTMPWWAAAPVVVRDVVLGLLAVVIFATATEKPRVTKVGKYANFVLMWSVGFFMIAVRPVAWVLYISGAALYLYSGVLYCVGFWRLRHGEPQGGAPSA